MIAHQHNVRDQVAEDEPALKHTAQEVQDARTAIRQFLEEYDDGQAWTFSKIQDRVTGWSSTLVSLALFSMLGDGELDVSGDLKVRLSQAKI